MYSDIILATSPDKVSSNSSECNRSVECYLPIMHQSSLWTTPKARNMYIHGFKCLRQSRDEDALLPKISAVEVTMIYQYDIQQLHYKK